MYTVLYTILYTTVYTYSAALYAVLFTALYNEWGLFRPLRAALSTTLYMSLCAVLQSVVLYAALYTALHTGQYTVLYTFFHLQAVTVYRVELAKWGATALADEDLVNMATTTGDQAQCTAFESHLCRSLNKQQPEARKASLQKYAAIFAHVAPSSIQKVLWTHVQELLK